jgi:hypothetical protein
MNSELKKALNAIFDSHVVYTVGADITVAVGVAHGQAYRGIAVCHEEEPFQAEFGKHKAYGRLIRAYIFNREKDKINPWTPQMEMVRRELVHYLGKETPMYKCQADIPLTSIERTLLCLDK